MRRKLTGLALAALALSATAGGVLIDASLRKNEVGLELGLAAHMQDDEEYTAPLDRLLEHGRRVFSANWTRDEGGGRPLTKGNGRALADASAPLVGGRAFNRISGPDANSCMGCHNQPYGVAGGSGDFVANVFVQGQRFDFATFDRNDAVPTRGAVDEQGQPVTLATIGNSRHTPGMFGAGYIEMLAREITMDLQKIRDGMRRGETRALVAKGIDFGKLTRRADGLWDVSAVTGLPRLSLITATPIDPPSLVVRPWHQAGNSVSLRDFTNTSFNHHHGIQSTERFGANTDPDGDHFSNELTRADVTAASIFQAAMAVPGQVIPNDPNIERAILRGQRNFNTFGCAACHVPTLPLSREGWTYSEPGPFNPAGNLRAGDAKTVKVNLNDPALPQPRLAPEHPDDLVMLVPAYTDFKLHDICDPADPMPLESLDMNWPVWAPKFPAGNRRFLTRRLWGIANSGPYFHHGMYSTMREAVLGHSGEALASRKAFQAAGSDEQAALIEFLKSLQVLPPGTTSLVVDEHYRPKKVDAAAIAAAPAPAVAAVPQRRR
ncbi:di-heme oxidoreductase (putative peroxidase) [Pseudoduganella flava]|uniref:Di-heme oxidoreductase (Putative peroxidase) n=1 Tax=Pseudoduganella flava TaxID=871742 RepID=A0A562PKI2_9BURK|nr:di-heme oxidoredictase family protein [Pseudoduganella flava]QGZ42384.1 thiol oxidoreductase [Pseudoduganella flava]TWI44944.1 di-heme oxidoreductase (putative peroxidase) [Pseudoduganella flava]